MKTILLLILFILIPAGSIVLAADVPEPSPRDARVRYLDYKADDVTVVHVRRGVVTRIMLEQGEKIKIAATGFSADCSDESLEWCIRADLDSNQIWVKPRNFATHNNLELHTNRRDYSFDFRVLSDRQKGYGARQLSTRELKREPMFRIIFRYPKRIPSFSEFSGQASGGLDTNWRQMGTHDREQQLLSQRLDQMIPRARNLNYSMKVMKHSEDIVPSMVFDDGRFTYFRFPANQEIPTIFYIAPSGEETRLNFHMRGDFAVVQRVGRRFVLRLGSSVVGIWNDNFDKYGVAPQDGTTVRGVERVIRY